ncbi:MAG: helix-turn-helix domain-containing protein [Chloroflexota bacterium]|nr:helix-turn-helix domain-containing protein [Chloroflexota bacterium]
MTMLRSIREKKGLTVSQLAARASIPSRVIADYEEGRLAMPLNHARLIAKALWVPIEDLMPPAGTVIPPSSPVPAAPQYAPSQPPRTDSAPAGQQVAPAPRAEAATYTPAQPAPRPAESPGPMQAPPPQAAREGGRMRGVPQAGRGAPGDARQTRPARSLPHPPGPISEGQLQELSRLAQRLEIDQQQMEARIGKQLANLTRPEARDWIKKLRAIADEIAPSQRVHYGVWPEAQEDREAAYLRQQRDASSRFTFKLFNGEQFDGTLVDFTPYTITIRPDGGEDEMVLRKLAIAYYRRTGQGEATAATSGNFVTANLGNDTLLVPATSAAAESATATVTAHDHARDDSHQPLTSGIESDRAGEPEVPEEDNVDEDRGV